MSESFVTQLTFGRYLAGVATESQTGKQRTIISYIGAVSTTTLYDLGLSNLVLYNGVANSGLITNWAPGSSLGSSGAPAGMTLDLINHTWSWDGTGAVGSGTVNFTETLVSYTNSPHSSSIPYNIYYHLGTLSVVTNNFIIGTSGTSGITGWHVGSVLSATGLPSGLTISGTTLLWSGAGSVGSGSFVLAETNVNADNSPFNTTINYNILASGAALSIVSAPTVGGALVVGQTLYAANGTYGATPDSITPTWTVPSSYGIDAISDTLLLLDDYVGLTPSYSEIAHKSGYPDSASNTASALSAIVNIDLTSAITSITRTSASTVIPMTADIAFASNVYEGYFLRREVYSDSALTTSLGYATHTLTHADLQAGATIDWSADGGPTIAATNWIAYTVFTTSPNGYGYQFLYPTPISPTDAAIAMTWSTTDNLNVSLSTDHLTATGLNVNSGVRASRGIGSGKKVYWEVNASTMYLVGLADASASFSSQWGASEDGFTENNDSSTWFNLDGGILWFGTAASGNKVRITTGAWTNANVLGFGLDTTGGTPVIHAYLDGTLVGSATLTGISLPLFPAAQSNNGKVATLNPGITPGGTDGVVHPQAGYVNP